MAASRHHQPSSKGKPQAILLIAIVLLFIIIATVQLTTVNTPHKSTYHSFTFNNITYKFTGVEITLQQQEQGLMNATVNNSTFELFVFSKQAVYPFWMMNTYYPLDIIWINNTKVVYIVNATPCSWYSKNQTSCIIYNGYNSGHVANYVIEARSGFVNRTGMHVNSTVYIN